MEVLVFLVPLALTLGAIGLMGFLWSLKNGQHDDIEGAGWRAIADDDPVSEEPVPVRSTGTRRRQGATEPVESILPKGGIAGLTLKMEQTSSPRQRAISFSHFFR